MKKVIGLLLFFIATQTYASQVSTLVFGGGCITNVGGYAKKQTCSVSGIHQQLEYSANRLKNPLTNKCLTAQSHNNGSKIIYTQCQKNSVAQTFSYDRIKKEFVHTASHKCLDVHGGNRTDLILWSCHGGINQQFNIPQSNTDDSDNYSNKDITKSPIRNNLIMEYIPDDGNVEYDRSTKKISKIKNTADWDSTHVYDLLQTKSSRQPYLRRKNGNNYIFFNKGSRLINTTVWANDPPSSGGRNIRKGFTKDGTDMTIYIVVNSRKMNNRTLLAWNKGYWQGSHKKYTSTRMSLDLPRGTGRAVAFFGNPSDGISDTTLKSRVFTNSEIIGKKLCWKFETYGTTRTLYKNFVAVVRKMDVYSHFSGLEWGKFVLGSNDSKHRPRAYVYAVLVYKGKVSVSDDTRIRNWIKRKFKINDVKITRIVTDPIARLQWQDNSDAGTVKKPWVKANSYLYGRFSDTSGDTATTYCANLTLGGYTNWRLPTVGELEPVMRNPNKYKVFQYMGTGKYWTSTPAYVNTSWTVGRGERKTWATRDISLNVRCVRTE
ncbi:MAG: ricin-type beta-trefoil lectin domain protein [Sulfurovum sp.]|nr:ricin-type beta-trefoil lectin domain protein [Sulfurovum sp.]